MATNPLNNQNYINKDFQTIYPELLDAVKKITYKWDPTISNESDPGVILLKLNAIIADKNNYNIDKNILECFPDTVSQYGNAYNLYSQLGYNMRWYWSANGQGTIAYKPTEEEQDDNNTYILPIFTMFCDEDKENIYTTTEELQMFLNGESYAVNIMQGVIRDLKVGNSKKIIFSNLDHRMRLYFPVSNVAQNGIFISNAKEVKENDTVKDYEFDSSNRWEQVDNLHIQPLGSKVYEFGIDQSNNSCYVEFPLDAANLISEGIIIKYIQSDGQAGNISSQRLTTCYKDIVLSDEKTLNNQNILFKNYNAITNGKNPETIDEAYINYKKTVGTFDTLVTLRDYLNYILNDSLELVSNGTVSDRTCDLQDSYSYITFEDDNDEIKYKYEGMNAFDLKTYFFNYSKFPLDTASTSNSETVKIFREAYDKSFTLKGLSTDEKVKNAYNDVKSIQHDFKNIESNRPIFIKNKFDLNLTVIPNTLISKLEAEDIKRNIYISLMKNFQSKNIEVGKEITYEQIYDVCNKADPRIKAIALDNFDYKPNVLWYDNNDKKYKETPLPTNKIENTDSDSYGYDDEIALEFLAKNILAGKTPLYIRNTDFQYQLNQQSSNSCIAEKITTDCTFTFSRENPTQTVLSNESICLYAPNLIDLINYTTGVKYVYYNDANLSASIPSNVDYVLGSNESLTLFWTTEEGTDALYSYITYEEGTIINATFPIVQEPSLPDRDSVGQLIRSTYTGEGMINGVFNDTIKNLSGSEHVLSTSRTITIKKLEQVKLDQPKNLCYWITNDIVTTNGSDQYSLILDLKENIDEFSPKESYPIKNSNSEFVAISNYTGTFNLNNDNKTLIYERSRKVAQGLSATYFDYSFKKNLSDLSDDEEIETNIQPVQINTSKSFTVEKQYDGYVYIDGYCNKNDSLGSITQGDTSLSDGQLYLKNFELDKNLVGIGYYINLEEVTNSEITYYTEYDELFNAYDKVNDDFYIIYLNESGTTPGWYGPIDLSSIVTDTIDTTELISLGDDCIKTFGITSIPNRTTLKILKLETSIPGIRYNLGTEEGIGTDYTITYSLDFDAIAPEIEEGEVFTIDLGYYITDTAVGGNNEIVWKDFANDIIDNYVKSNSLEVLLTGGLVVNIGSYTSSNKYPVYQKILKNNEWFIYTDINFSYFEILGAGNTVDIISSTQLQYDSPSPSISFEIDAWMDANTIQNQISDFSDKKLWYTFKFDSGKFNPAGYDKENSNYNDHNFGDLVTCTANQLIYLGEGSQIEITSNTDFNMSICSQGTYESVRSDSPNIKSKILWKYSVKYKSPNETSWQYLPRNVNNDLKWDAYSILNINISEEVPQQLHKEHFNTFIIPTIGEVGQEDYQVETKIPADFNGNSDYYLQSNVPVTLPGGKNIDVRYLDFNDLNDQELKRLKLYYYYTDLSSSFSNTSNISITSEDNKIIVNIPYEQSDSVANPSTSENEITFNIQLPNIGDNPPKYILPINSQRELIDGESLNITISPPITGQGTASGIPFIDGLDTNTDIGVDRRYAILSGVSNETYAIKFAANILSDLTFTLYPIYTCNYAFDGERGFSNINDELIVNENALITKLNEYSDNKFNYVYEPDDNIVIRNPLFGKNYFNSNNFTNKYSIANIDKLNIKVVNIK